MVPNPRFLERSIVPSAFRHPTVADLVVVFGLAAALTALVSLAGQVTTPHRSFASIDLSISSLPRYTLLSLSRGCAAYCISLVFTIGYAYWAAKDELAGKLLIPLLDVLQSIPVLSFMPAIMMGLVRLFPSTNAGLELAVILSIFTGQVWNMVFSLYHSLRSVPQERRELASMFRFTAWETARWIELPGAAMGLVWNSMMSMAGGWVFLSIIENFRLRNQDFRLPGIGSYMSEAWRQQNFHALFAGMLAMVGMIVFLDQIVWRPVVAWAQKFRGEEESTSNPAESWINNVLRKSRLIRWMRRRLKLGEMRPGSPSRKRETLRAGSSLKGYRLLSAFAMAMLFAWIVFGSIKLVDLLSKVSRDDWQLVFSSAAWTLGRVALSTTLATLWALPLGLFIGLNPRLAGWAQPIVQIIASFPAPILFPAVVSIFTMLGISLGWGSIALIMMGTQWYILFNVISGAMALPFDLREAATSFRWPFWSRVRFLYLPGVFPYLVTGWVTAAGGAWNLSIVAEYIHRSDDQIERAKGLGALIADAFDRSQEGFPMLAASTLVLASMVVFVNRTLWSRLYSLAETRFTLVK